MKKQNLLSREEAIIRAGEETLKKLDNINCEPTSRVGVCGACAGDELTEWSASTKDLEGNTITAYYYTTNEQDAAMADAGMDGSVITWEIEGYEID